MMFNDLLLILRAEFVRKLNVVIVIVSVRVGVVVRMEVCVIKRHAFWLFAVFVSGDIECC